MRLSSIIGVALVAMSTAALAQVASTPVEQKTPLQVANNASDDAPSGNTSDRQGNAAPVQSATEAPANTTPAAGDPAAATGQPPKR